MTADNVLRAVQMSLGAAWIGLWVCVAVTPKAPEPDAAERISGDW